MTEEFVADAPVDFEALRHGHAQARQHDCDEAACAGAVHVVEVVTWQQLVLVKVVTCAAWHGPILLLQASLALGDFVHEALDDEQAGVASNAAAIWCAGLAGAVCAGGGGGDSSRPWAVVDGGGWMVKGGW